MRLRIHLSLLIMVFITYVSISTNYTNVFAISSADNKPPSAPTGLTSTVKSYRSVSLSWKAATDNVGVKGYQLYRDGKKLLSITKTSYTNNSLIPGRRYTYSLKAYDAAGNLSQYSQEYSVTTLSDTQLPSAPSDLYSSCADYTSISLCWKPSSDNTSVKCYEIYCNYKKTASTTDSCYVCKRLTPGTVYNFEIKACDIAGNYSSPSNKITVSTLPDKEAPSAPTGLKSALITETEVGLTWLPSMDNVKIKGYEIICDGNKIGSTSRTTYSCKKLIPGVSYTFTIKALDTVGNVSENSQPLKTATVKDVQKPTVPTNLKIKSSTKSSVSITWNPSSDNVKVKGYKIYCNFIEVNDTNLTHCTVKCPKGIGVYIIWVKAYDLVNNISDSSGSITVIIP